MRTNLKAPWDYRLIIIMSFLAIILGGSLLIEPIVLHTTNVLAIILRALAFGIYGCSIQPKKLKIIRFRAVLG